MTSKMMGSAAAYLLKYEDARFHGMKEVIGSIPIRSTDSQVFSEFPQRAQNPSEATPWGFNSPSRHHHNSSISRLFSFIYTFPDAHQ
jgi:hypothetical protein